VGLVNRMISPTHFLSFCSLSVGRTNERGTGGAAVGGVYFIYYTIHT